MLSSLAFYPSLGYNLLRNYLQPSKWTWYNRVDDVLLVGALPFKSMQDELIQKENVGGVVCCVEDFELNYAYNAIRKEDWRDAGVQVHEIPMTDFFGSAARPQIDSAVQFIDSVAAKGKSVYDWRDAGVQVHEIPMTDFFGSAARPQIDSAVQFIDSVAAKGKSVYVHCKAGRTRSATVAVCYLMKSRNWLPNVAVEYLKSKRPQTVLRNAHWRTANEYRRFLDRHSS
ncbi:dual specificity phosphatase, catalytic domain protein [Cooperia oncophora]